MVSERKQEALFGSFDGVVSVIGFIFGLLLHHSPESAIAFGGIGGGVAAAVSMGAGEIEKSSDSALRRLPVALAMFVASFIGAFIAIWPFLVFSSGPALVFAALGCIGVASWIGYEKHAGLKGFIAAYLTLLIAAGLTLGIVALIPASA